MDDLLQICEGIVGFECFSNLAYVGDLIITKTVDSIIHKPQKHKKYKEQKQTKNTIVRIIMKKRKREKKRKIDCAGLCG